MDNQMPSTAPPLGQSVYIQKLSDAVLTCIVSLRFVKNPVGGIRDIMHDAWSNE